MNAHGGVIQQQMGEAAPVSLAQARSYVYFLRPVGERGPVKIGYSRAPYSRLQTYAAWSPQTLEIVALIEGGEKLERRFHGQFEHLRLHHEWFKADPALDAVIEAIGAGTFDIETLGLPARLRQEHGWTDESKRAAGYAQRLNTLKKRGIAIPQEVAHAANQYRCSPEETDRRRAVVREFVDRAIAELEAPGAPA